MVGEGMEICDPDAIFFLEVLRRMRAEAEDDITNRAGDGSCFSASSPATSLRHHVLDEATDIWLSYLQRGRFAPFVYLTLEPSYLVLLERAGTTIFLFHDGLMGGAMSSMLDGVNKPLEVLIMEDVLKGVVH